MVLGSETWGEWIMLIMANNNKTGNGIKLWKENG